MCNLTAPHFQDADEARKYLEELRWPDGAICPHCGETGAWPIEGGRKGLYRCKKYQCRKQFTVTVGTAFEDSKVPLNKWLMATYLMCSSKKGVSSKQLERTLGVTYKTAWFMSHRIRVAMKEEQSTPFGSGSGVVEVDEIYIKKKKNTVKRRGDQHKQKVVSLVDRDTKKVKSVKVGRINAKSIKPILDKGMAKEATLMTEEAHHY